MIMTIQVIIHYNQNGHNMGHSQDMEEDDLVIIIMLILI